MKITQAIQSFLLGHYIKKAKKNIKIENGHMVINLKCPNCNHTGKATYETGDFKCLGKDNLGHLYFECPECKKHLQFHPLSGSIKLVL